MKDKNYGLILLIIKYQEANKKYFTKIQILYNLLLEMINKLFNLTKFDFLTKS